MQGKDTTVMRSQNFVFHICIFQVHSKIKYPSCMWRIEKVCDFEILEMILRCWTNRINGFPKIPFRDRLNHLYLFSVHEGFNYGMETYASAEIYSLMGIIYLSSKCVYTFKVASHHITLPVRK